MRLLWARQKNRITDVAGYGTSSQTTSGKDYRGPLPCSAPLFSSPPRRDAATGVFVTN